MIKSQNHQVIRPVGKPLTEAEKAEQNKQKILQFLQQKRDQFSISILCHKCHNPFLSKKRLVKKSVALADALIEKLYPIPENKQEEKQEQE